MTLLEICKKVNTCNKLLISIVTPILVKVSNELGIENITFPQYLALTALSDVKWWEAYIPKHPEITSGEYSRPTENAVVQYDLADYLSSDKVTLLSLVKRMEQQGNFIARYNQGKGKWRAVWIELTEEGRELFATVQEKLNAELDAELKELDFPNIPDKDLKGLDIIEQAAKKQQ